MVVTTCYLAWIYHPTGSQYGGVRERLIKSEDVPELQPEVNCRTLMVMVSAHYLNIPDKGSEPLNGIQSGSVGFTLTWKTTVKKVVQNLIDPA